MPMQIGQSGASAGLAPRRRSGARHRLALVDEHPLRVVATALLQNAEGVPVERHAYGLPTLGVLGRNVGGRAREIHQTPSEMRDVVPSQARRQRERGHAAQMLRQLGKQPASLVAGDPTDPALVLRRVGDGWDAVGPSLLVGVAQDGGQEGHVAVRRGVCDAALQHGRADLTKMLGADGLNGFVDDQRGQHAQFEHVVGSAALVPTHRLPPVRRGGLQRHVRRLAQLGPFPELRFESVVEFLGFFPVRRPTRASNSASRVLDVNPPNVATLPEHRFSSPFLPTYWPRSQSNKSSSKNTQRLPGLAAGISPAFARCCTVSG
ncbi:hypothetical protein PJU76_02165 [Acidithiobacillus ferriphilus]|nr:hypothetical protein [Acidithiobacillus ferriphilus]WCE94369.1 hypothetical protein PJU76_02165 [Acidithiobacillus ferriphilus]